MKLNYTVFITSLAMLVLVGCESKTAKKEASESDDSKISTDTKQPVENLNGIALLQSFSTMALNCIHQEYPNHIGHYLLSDDDVKAPRDMHPIFYGCLDWHSAVHGHWMLVRILRLNPDFPEKDAIIAALDNSFSAEKGALEAAYFEERTSYERPYGWAWLLQLSSELREWDHPKAKQWLASLAPIEEKITASLAKYLTNMVYPVRAGTHAQTAFGMGLILDYTRTVGMTELETLITKRMKDYYAGDVNCPIGYEPSGSDFLSPCLMEADLMRRVMTQDAYAVWLSDFFPTLPTDGSGDWISPGVVLDPTDGQLVHLDGLNLSRAWALEGIAAGLPDGDARRESLMKLADIHTESGVEAVSNSHYMGSHWLASFATYLETKRGIE